MKKMVGVLSLITILLFVAPMTAQAASDNALWTKSGNNQWVLQGAEGTNLQARIRDDILYVSGTGEIPTYSRDALGNRPWHGKKIYEIHIEKGITSIGAEAFSNLADVHKVEMFASTFVEDATAFAGFDKEAVITFSGVSLSGRTIGSIPYTSLDSITAVMQKYSDSYTFRLANYYVIGMAQYGVYPRMSNIVPLDATGQDHDSNYPWINCDSTISYVSGDRSYGSNMTIQYRKQGMAALNAFAAFAGDNQFAAAYNISVNYGTKQATGRISTPVQYAITIPAAYRYPGRKFSLLQIQPGTVCTLQDEDMSDDTITFTTDYPTTSYALIYTDN